jgi:hypothetical protein
MMKTYGVVSELIEECKKIELTSIDYYLKLRDPVNMMVYHRFVSY